MVGEAPRAGRRRAVPAGDRNRRPQRLGAGRRRDQAAWPTSTGSCFPAATAWNTFSAACSQLGHDLRALGGRKLAAIGPATVDALAPVPPEGRPFAGRRTAPKPSPKRSRRKPRAIVSSSPAPAAAAKCSPKCSPPPAATSRKPSSTKAATSTEPNPDVLEALDRRPHRLDHRHQLRHRPLAGQPVRRRSAAHQARRHQPADGRRARRAGPSAGCRRGNLYG